jgi:hypothetical protein
VRLVIPSTPASSCTPIGASDRIDIAPQLLAQWETGRRFFYEIPRDPKRWRGPRRIAGSFRGPKWFWLGHGPPVGWTELTRACFLRHVSRRASRPRSLAVWRPKRGNGAPTPNSMLPGLFLFKKHGLPERFPIHVPRAAPGGPETLNPVNTLGDQSALARWCDPNANSTRSVSPAHRRTP